MVIIIDNVINIMFIWKMFINIYMYVGKICIVIFIWENIVMIYYYKNLSLFIRNEIVIYCIVYLILVYNLYWLW